MPTPEREQIAVLAMFRSGMIEPLRFKKGGRVYDITSVNLRYEARQGREELLYFFFFYGSQTHKLVYETDKRRWYVEEEEWL